MMLRINSNSLKQKSYQKMQFVVVELNVRVESALKQTMKQRMDIVQHPLSKVISVSEDQVPDAIQEY